MSAVNHPLDVVAEAIEKAGGIGIVAKACSNRGKPMTNGAVSQWRTRGMPRTEWTGETRYARIICDLAHAIGHEDVSPIDLCPGAGQYLIDQAAA